MRDRLLTIFLSVVVTYAVMEWRGPRRYLEPAHAAGDAPRTLEVDRLIVRRELIVSDTGKPWEEKYEAEQIPRGIYARSVGDGPGGLWVRSRLIKGEVDDPFDDRFHAVETDGSLRRAPGHISWNVWLDGAWRQMAIVQGEAVEWNEWPREKWNGSSHPGRLRFQTFRPNHNEPLTDAVIGQGGMSVGGGGYGGGGLPYATSGLDVWGGRVSEHDLARPTAPRIVGDDKSSAHRYAIVAASPWGQRTAESPVVDAKGRAKLEWDSVAGADVYFVIRDGREIAGPLRIEGSNKVWQDNQP